MTSDDVAWLVIVVASAEDAVCVAVAAGSGRIQAGLPEVGGWRAGVLESALQIPIAEDRDSGLWHPGDFQSYPAPPPECNGISRSKLVY